MKAFEKLISSLKRLPGLGPKQAERIALHLLRVSGAESEALIGAIREAKTNIRTCAVCFTYSETEICAICSDEARDRATLCVVEEPSDVSAIERSRSFRGRYHVLHGALSPLEGIGPDMIRTRELFERVRADSGVREVILATDPDTEGEATALYLHEALAKFPVKITRIALGVPMGGDLDYVDERTMSSALLGRREIVHKES
ncbi:MAG: recombination protein RecR [Elusimicrobia bacterium]|nr:recombination protein RecR [Elusimicrobiota bacterium]